jgi:hypothetical protein
MHGSMNIKFLGDFEKYWHIFLSDKVVLVLRYSFFCDMTGHATERMDHEVFWPL